MKLRWEPLVKKAANRVSGGLNESMKPAPIILSQNTVGFSQLVKMKGFRKCFTPETSAAVQLGADQNSARKYNCSLCHEQGSRRHAVLPMGG